MPRPTLPTEICERIIDAIADLPIPLLEREQPLIACALVCRSWVPRARVHLYTNVLLESDTQTRKLLHTLSRSPNFGRFAETLTLSIPLAMRELDADLEDQAEFGYGYSKELHANWIYKAIHMLPKYLTNVRELQLQDLPELHPSFAFHCSRFTKVESLLLVGLSASFSEIVQLINRLSKLRQLDIRDCGWSQPLHYNSRPQRKPTLTALGFRCDYPSCGTDLLKWLSKSHSGAILTHLRWSAIFPDHHVALNEALQSCSNTLEYASFGAGVQLAPEGKLSQALPIIRVYLLNAFSSW